MFPHSRISLPTIDRDEFLPAIGRWSTVGGLLLLSTVAAGVALAALVPYTVTIRAAAIVRPTQETQFVQTPISGTVSQILVKAGQSVRRGQPIARLDPTQLQTRQQDLMEMIATRQRQLVQLEAQRRDLIQQRQAVADGQDRSIVMAEVDLRQRRRRQREQQILAQTQVQEATATLELAKTALQKYQQLAQTGSVAELEVREKLAAFQAAQAQLTRAQAMVHADPESIEIATAQVAQQQAQRSTLFAQLDQEDDQLRQESLEQQNQLNHDRRDLEQIEQTLAQHLITATADGTILTLNLHNPGQVVQLGETIAQITPDRAPLLIKAQVVAQDVSQVQVCRAATFSDCSRGQVYVRLSAYPYPDYGSLRGVVRSVTADVLPHTSTDPGYYEVTIQPEQNYLERGDRLYPLQAGMEGTAEIVSRRDTVLKLMLRKARLLSDF